LINNKQLEKKSGILLNKLANFMQDFCLLVPKSNTELRKMTEAGSFSDFSLTEYNYYNHLTGQIRAQMVEQFENSDPQKQGRSNQNRAIEYLITHKCLPY